MKTIDLVVPCYNEQDVITTFYTESHKILSDITDYSIRYIFVNDGSKDDTLMLIKGLASTYNDVKYISFSRNFGKESAMYAGLANSTADYVAVMDADLQHPPALIHQMIKSVESGHDCCAAYRVNRKGEKKIRSAFSRSFYKFNNKLTSAKMPYGAVDYRLMSRKMVNSIVNLSEVQRFSKGIFCWVGFDTEWIPYENVERTMGQTKWSFSGLAKYAMDGILSFSVAPLRMLSITGIFISVVAIIYALYILISTIATGNDSPGYASTIIIILFLGGIIELSLGILGEYISRIFTEIKHRPIYIEKESNLTCDDIPEASDVKETNK